jgi:hypothetical protein
MKPANWIAWLVLATRDRLATGWILRRSVSRPRKIGGGGGRPAIGHGEADADAVLDLVGEE